jgi:hypothetical protein
VEPTLKKRNLDAPKGDVFAEMKGCVERGLSGRPSLARFVEVTYEGILLLKAQADRIERRLSELEASMKRPRGPHGRRSARDR